MAKFKRSVLEIMKSDPKLFAALSEALKIKPASLPMTIERNGKTLNQYDIVKLVAAHLKKSPEELLEKESKTKVAQN